MSRSMVHGIPGIRPPAARSRRRGGPGVAWTTRKTSYRVKVNLRLMAQRNASPCGNRAAHGARVERRGGRVSGPAHPCPPDRSSGPCVLAGSSVRCKHARRSSGSASFNPRMPRGGNLGRAGVYRWRSVKALHRGPGSETDNRLSPRRRSTPARCPGWHRATPGPPRRPRGPRDRRSRSGRPWSRCRS